MRFITILPIWGWPHLFKRFGKETLFLADRQFLKAYQSKHHRLNCLTGSPDGSDIVDIPAGVKSVLVFLRKGEMRLVRVLREKYPDCQIFSVQYDLIPNCLSWPAKLPSLKSTTPKSDASVQENASLASGNIRLIISTACSDAEYLAQALENRGSGPIADAFARPFSYLLDYVKDFQPARYAARLLQLHAAEGGVSIQVPVEALFDLIEHTPLSASRFQGFLKRNNVRALYFRRNDKLIQSVLLELVLRKRFRSIWSVATEKRKALTRNAKVSVPKALAHMAALNAGEHDMEQLLTGIDDVVHVSLDQFNADQGSTLMRVWREMGFAGEMQPPQADLPPHEECYITLDGFAANILTIQRELIDRTGLHLYNQQKRAG